MHVDPSNISKEQVRPYLGSEISKVAEDLGLTLDPDARYYLYCPATELAKSVDLWNGQQLKIDHLYGDANDPGDNWVGSVYGAEFEAPFLKARLSINDKTAMYLLESGEYKELSASYLYDLENKPGTFDGVKYDFIITNIRPNHVAMVPKGRAGRDCCVEDTNLNETKGVDFMDFIDRIVAALLGVKNAEAPPAQDEPPETNATEGPPVSPAQDEVNVEAIIEAIAGVDPGLAEKVRTAMTAQDEPPVDETVADEPVVGDEDETKEPDKQPAMDAALIEKNVAEKMQKLYQAAKKVKPIVGDVDPFAYKSEADIYKLVLDKKGLVVKNYPKEAWRGMAEMAIADNAMQWKPVVESTGYDKTVFPFLGK